MGYCSLKRLRGGGLGEGSFTGNPKDEWRALEREKQEVMQSQPIQIRRGIFQGDSLFTQESEFW